jgi:hypothetical protein
MVVSLNSGLESNKEEEEEDFPLPTCPRLAGQSENTTPCRMTGVTLHSYPQ